MCCGSFQSAAYYILLNPVEESPARYVVRLVVGFALILGAACEVGSGCQGHIKETISLQIYFSGLKINLPDGLEKR
jgi:hypothetical protein